MVRRWIELCMPETWYHSDLTRVICLEPLDIHHGELTLMNMRTYVERIGTQLTQIASGSMMWLKREQVDLIVIPVRIAGTWLLYITQRTGNSQTVVRIAGNFVNDTDASTTEALQQLDTQLHTMGRGAMEIWLRMLRIDIMGLGAAA